MSQERVCPFISDTLLLTGIYIPSKVSPVEDNPASKPHNASISQGNLLHPTWTWMART